MDRWLSRHLGGHVKIGNLTIYGFNAMHVTFQYWSRRLRSYVCFHPSIFFNGRWWHWKFYISRNATPWAATYCIGRGTYREDRQKAARRLRMLRVLKAK